MARFQNIFTEVFLQWHSAKIAFNGSAWLNKMAAGARAKN